MKIKLNDNSIMKAALAKVEDGDFYDALRLFNRVDSYESDLNKIGCFAILGDAPCAVELYREMKSRYFDTKNCYHDAALLGNSVEVLLSVADKLKPTLRDIDGDPKKQFADENLLGDYFTELEKLIMEQPEFDFLNDVSLYDDPALDESNFYDIKSVEYFDSLRVRLEKAYLDCDSENVEALKKRFLNIDTDHIPTIEAQMSMCVFEKDYETGVKLAVKFADMQDVTEVGVRAAIKLLSSADGFQKSAELYALLNKAAEIADDIDSIDLERYILLAYNNFGDLTLAYILAKSLHETYKFNSVESLKTCVCVFCNYGDVDLARDALKELFAVLPSDHFAYAMFEMLEGAQNGDKVSVEIPCREYRHYFVPRLIVTRYCDYFADILTKTKPIKKYILSNDDLDKLSVLIATMKLYVLSRRTTDFYKLSDLLAEVFSKCNFDDKDKFSSIALTETASLFADCSLGSVLLERLIRFGKRGKVLISSLGRMYSVDLSQITVTDAMFVKAFSVCATIRKVDVKKMQQAYLALKTTVELPSKSHNAVKQVAYAMLSAVINNFAQESDAEWFAIEDAALYKTYLDALS